MVLVFCKTSVAQSGLVVNKSSLLRVPGSEILEEKGAVLGVDEAVILRIALVVAVCSKEEDVHRLNFSKSSRLIR